MKCSCPKCHAEIELALTDVTEAGTPAACPLCKARLVVHRESFGGRVFRKTGEISCASCGELLGPRTFCTSCGMKFPDYLAVTQGRKPSGRAVGSVKLKASPFSRPREPKGKLPKLEATAARDAKPATETKPVRKRFSKSFQIIMCAGLVVVLSAAGVFLVVRHKSEQRYARNFVKATYCMQTGADRALKGCSKLSAEWKTRNDSGQAATMRLGTEEERALRMIRSNVDGFMQEMQEPPAKYADANGKFSRLHSSYMKVTSFALNPPTSQTLLAENATKLENEYKSAGRDFKNGLPDSLMNELRQAVKRHQSLKPLVE